jgi:hypothetical protein
VSEINNCWQRSDREVAAPLAPPQWAARSIPEDGGITHEVVSLRHPAIRLRTENSCGFLRTDVSLSAVDHYVNGDWTRGAPTIQIEGGSYSLDGIRELRKTLDEFLDCATWADESGDGSRAVVIPGL